MPKVKIEHNPYTITTRIEIDGRETQNRNLCEKTTGSRLQCWIDDVVERLMTELNCRRIELDFTGTPADCEDVRNAVDLANAKKKHDIRLVAHPGEDPFFKLEQIKSLRERAQKGPVRQLKSKEFLDDFNKAIDPTFMIGILAPMKAGKSTFINALLGRHLMPEHTDPCTATIVYIEHDENAKDFNGFAIGADGKKNTRKYGQRVITREILEAWNKEAVREVHITGKIPAINSNRHIRLVLVDTPGPNNANNLKHEETFRRFLTERDNSMALYLINIKNSTSTDNQRTLMGISDAMKRPGRQSSDRFLFVVTHADELDPDKGESLEASLGKIRSHLQGNPIGIPSPRLIPVTALNTKLNRMVAAQETITRKDKSELDCWSQGALEDERLRYDRNGDYSSRVRERIKKRIEKSSHAGDKQNLLDCYSGIAGVEATIEEYIERYALPMKITDAWHAIEKQFKAFNLQAELEQNLLEDNARREEMHARMKKAQQALKDGEKGQAFREEVRNIRWNDEQVFKNDRNNARSVVEKAYRSLKTQMEASSANNLIEPTAAKNLLDAFNSEIEDLVNGICNRLTENIDRTIKPLYEQLVSEYNSHVADLLGATSADAPEVQQMTHDVPDWDQLRKSSTYTEVIRQERRLKPAENLFVELWRDFVPFSQTIERQFDSRMETVQHKGKRVRIEELLPNIHKTLTQHVTDLGQRAVKQTEEQVKAMANDFVADMDRLDDVIKEKVKEMEKLTRSYRILEESVSKTESQRQYLVDFESEMNALLTI